MKYRYDTFFSYSHKDGKKALQIIDDLKDAGYNIWWDQDLINAGDRIRDLIAEGLSKSRSVIILSSPRSLQSKWVLNELDAAMITEIEERRKFVIPILIGRITTDQIPADIRGKSWIDLRNGFERKLRQQWPALLRAIEGTKKVDSEFRCLSDKRDRLSAEVNELVGKLWGQADDTAAYHQPHPEAEVLSTKMATLHQVEEELVKKFKIKLNTS